MKNITKKMFKNIVNKILPFYYDVKELQYKRMNGWLFLVLIIFSTITFSLGWLAAEKNEIARIKKFEDEEKLVIIKNGDKFSEEKLILFINELNFKWPEVVYAQAILESGSKFNSDINIENNNYFGMKMANIRVHTQLAENLDHAVFLNWRMSVIDYALFWSTYLSDLKTKEEYYQYIEKHYSKTPGYSLRVMNAEKEYFQKLSKIKAKNSYDIFDFDYTEPIKRSSRKSKFSVPKDSVKTNIDSVKIQ